ncbi:hypothetical protein ISCGN_002140 [Ixodes scapularis]
MGKKANAEDVRVALEYYTRDDLACSIQSPNKKDVVKAMINDNKTKVVKRFMTRSVKETYQLFGKDHPHRELGISKFYSLRPKWVKKSPEHEETFTEDDFKRIYLCSPPQNDCFLRRCEKCPKMQSISLQSLHLDEDEEICYALWDAGELVKKVMDTSAFLKELESWSEKSRESVCSFGSRSVIETAENVADGSSAGGALERTSAAAWCPICAELRKQTGVLPRFSTLARATNSRPDDCGLLAWTLPHDWQQNYYEVVYQVLRRATCLSPTSRGSKKLRRGQTAATRLPRFGCFCSSY